MEAAGKEISLPSDGSVTKFDDGADLWCRSGSEGDSSGFRGSYFEQRETEQVRTTFTALHGEGGEWAWVDLERWSDEPFGPGWVPYAPGIVKEVMDYATCFRGDTRFPKNFREIGWKGAEQVAAEVLDPDREIPVVIATPTAEEIQNDFAPARKRAAALQRHLRGLAPVILLKGPGVESFSTALHDAGLELDVHTGAIRTYLPGAADNQRSRHRLILPGQLRGRADEVVGRFISLPLMRAACNAPPPPFWVNDLRDLISERERGRSDQTLETLLDVAEAERAAAEKHKDEAEASRIAAEQNLELERETVAEILDESELLRRRLRYAQEQIRTRGETPGEPVGEVQAPDFCSEVVALVAESCPKVVLGPDVEQGAEVLDEHAERSWALKAWRAFRALQAYAEWKTADGSSAENFAMFCRRGDHDDVIPISWVSMNESQATDQNPQFRELRTFPVPAEVEETESVYMDAHIKIERGGSLAPRIHFHDDTEGATGKIHVGWFGLHLDSKAKK